MKYDMHVKLYNYYKTKKEAMAISYGAKGNLINAVHNHDKAIFDLILTGNYK